MQSLNQILKYLKDVAEAHRLIRTYAEGQTYDFSASDALLYPCLWAVPVGVSPSLSSNQMDYRIQVFMMDIEKADGSNEIEILSDTALILMDVIAKLQTVSLDYDDWDVSSAGMFEPFVDRGVDTVSGHSCELVISAFFAGDLCNDIFTS